MEKTQLFPRKDDIGIPAGFVHDLELKRLLLDNKITDKEKEVVPHLENH